MARRQEYSKNQDDVPVKDLLEMANKADNTPLKVKGMSSRQSTTRQASLWQK